MKKVLKVSNESERFSLLLEVICLINPKLNLTKAEIKTLTSILFSLDKPNKKVVTNLEQKGFLKEGTPIDLLLSLKEQIELDSEYTIKFEIYED